MHPINIHFTKLLKAKQLIREFNFRKLPSPPDEPLFHVDVSDDRGNRIIFKMSKHHQNGWKILDQDLPTWIYEAEPQLGENIEAGMQEFAPNL